jgi:hypothetical protein
MTFLACSLAMLILFACCLGFLVVRSLDVAIESPLYSGRVFLLEAQVADFSETWERLEADWSADSELSTP